MIPTVEDAERILREAEKMNPGPWVMHSFVAAKTARAIAQRCAGLDADRAYVSGLLHDIGRREGYTHLSHTLDGYRFLCSLGYETLAAICLTHSFPNADIHTYFGHVDCTSQDVAFIQEFLSTRVFDDYDRLVQLCDAIALPHGAVLMEKRLVDVVMRHGMPEWTPRKWKIYFELKASFDALAGANMYSFLEDIEKNTFML